jgi:hypothetical protein
MERELENLANKPADTQTFHYHIRWSSNSNSALDWAPYLSEADADDEAKRLVRWDETYTIERFNGNCPRCAAMSVPCFWINRRRI